MDNEECCLKNDSTNVSKNFYKCKKSQMFDLPVHFERCCYTLLVLGINRAKYKTKLIEAFLIPIVVNEQDIEQYNLKKSYST